MKAVSAPAPTACADVAIRLSFASLVETPFERPDLREATTIAGIDLTNDGPYDAENVTVIFKASTGDGSRIDLVDKGTFDSVSIGADRLSVTLTKTSMTCGSTDLANVRFSKLPPTEPPPVSGTSVVFSSTADPKPSNNVSASRSSQTDPRFVLDPVISEIVVTQVGRGK